MRKLLTFIATLGPVGYIPFAPGTFGTLVAMIVAATFAVEFTDRPALFWAVTLGSIIIGLPASQEAEKRLGKSDPSAVVIDEFAGFFLSLAFVPFTTGYLLAAFLLFRFFDILKPWPADRLQDLHGGAGVMLDDLAAGVYTAVLLNLWRLIQ